MSTMSDKFTVVKYTFEGEKFEILVKPDPALDYKLGKLKISVLFSYLMKYIRIQARVLGHHLKNYKKHSKQMML